jgi:EAL domain-containing protein (putative c-di-GMP-specific phosphodiesterase class I)/GGDEF domain-containing protein
VYRRRVGEEHHRVDGDGVPLTYDFLTGLVPPDVFDGHLERSLRRQWRAPTATAILLVRVENLALGNARLARTTVDEISAAAAVRLRFCVREVDIVARIRPDVLAVLLECDQRTGSPTTAAGEVAARMVSAFTEPLTTSAGDFAVNVRIGIAISDPEIESGRDLATRAEFALGVAACEPAGTFRFFDDDQQSSAVRRVTLKSELARAIERDQLTLRYQPLVALQTGLMVGVEPLLRWNHDVLGAISPGEFIPVAEQTGLINPIGTWVLEQAVAQYAEWRDTVPGMPVIGLSVNVSAHQLSRPGFLGTVHNALQRHDLDPRTLLLEITERAVMVDDAVTRAQIAGLRDLGVRFALDDFGTGFSSLEYLTRLPVDVLKIAQVFIDQLGTSTRSNAMVRAMIDLAHSLGLITVAEGVEHEEQAERLRKMGCFLAQGWHFARDLSVADATQSLRDLASRPAGDMEPVTAGRSGDRS